MALDITVAGPDADSYATVAEADGFVSWKDRTSAWSGAITADKEAVLKVAVDVIDSMILRNVKSSAEQALRFPLGDMTDSAGDLFIPERIKKAQSYLALHLLQNPTLLDGVAGIASVAVTGSFNVTMESGSSGGELPADVMRELDRYLLKSSPGNGGIWDSSRRGYI